MDVDAVETLDHLGGAGAGFDGLEDTEGDDGAATFVVQAVHVNDEGNVGEGLGEVEGVDADLPDVVPSANVEGRGGRLPRGASIDVREFEGDVTDAGAPVGDAELAGARGNGFAILAAHMRDARANPRLCHVHVLVLSFIRLWAAEQDTAGHIGCTRAKHRIGPRPKTTSPLPLARRSRARRSNYKRQTTTKWSGHKRDKLNYRTY